MKKLLIVIIFSVPFINGWAQREYLPTKDDLDHFYKTKTYIVLSDNPLSEYNFEIQDAVKKYWNITEYEFLRFKDFPEKSKDENGSFLYTAAVTFEKDKSHTRYNFLCLSLGGDYPSLDEMKDIANLPLSYYGVDEDSYTYKLGTFIIFLQDHIRLITENPGMISQNIYKHYNDNMANLSGKTLYFVEEELEREVSDEFKIKQVYSGDVKIVGKEEIKDIIMSGDKNAVFLHKVGPEGKKLDARVYKILVGAGDSKFYYFDFHKLSGKSPDAFLDTDFKALMKAQ
ncbi:MAG: hypothetical protein JXR52_05015 [Bacteroidales bacterium]|nr:hypothetical protein [Bacteroidales bacterium]MBN2698165.1 hypothetical protein [Bacteroidales bacterium]